MKFTDNTSVNVLARQKAFEQLVKGLLQEAVRIVLMGVLEEEVMAFIGAKPFCCDCPQSPLRALTMNNNPFKISVLPFETSPLLPSMIIKRSSTDKGSKQSLREKTKLVVKHRINIDQRMKRLLLSIEEEKQFLQDNRGLRKQFGSKIDTLEEALLKLPPQKNNLAILLKLEKDFHALDTQIDTLAKQKHNNYALMLHAVVGAKALIFMGAYFRLIPQNSLVLHPSIYIAAAALLLLVWILYFSLLEKSYQILFLYTVKPLAVKYPRYRRQLYWTAACMFNAVTFSPLMSAIQIFPRFINPHWDTFFINIANIIIQIFTSNAITSVVNILAILPCIFFLSQKVWKRVRKE